MRGFQQLTWTELKLFLREPAAVFFTIAFPLMLLFVFGGIFGNEPTDWIGTLGSVDISVPGYMGLIVGTTAFLSIPIIISGAQTGHVGDGHGVAVDYERRR